MSWQLSWTDEDEADFTDYSLTSREKLEQMYIGALPYGSNDSDDSNDSNDSPETLTRELKEFWIYPSMDTSLKESEIRTMFQQNDFSPLIPHISKRLVDIVNQYVPRYLCTFLNSKV